MFTLVHYSKVYMFQSTSLVSSCQTENELHYHCKNTLWLSHMLLCANFPKPTCLMYREISAR